MAQAAVQLIIFWISSIELSSAFQFEAQEDVFRNSYVTRIERVIHLEEI